MRLRVLVTVKASWYPADHEPVTEEVTEQPAPVAELDGELGVLGVLGVLGSEEGLELGVVLGVVLGVELGDVGPDPGVVVYVTCV